MKRVIIKKGNIFSVVIENSYKVYLQYVADDMTQLNSRVVRVFKQHYSLNENPSMDEIVKDEMDFYAHTMLRLAVWDDVFIKVGTHKDIGDAQNLMFRQTGDIDLSKITKSYKWYIWKINEPMVFIGELKEEFKNYEIGAVYPYSYILDRIRTGKYLEKIVE